MEIELELCDNCGEGFSTWKLRPDESPPPGMPTEPLCRSCWNTIALKCWEERFAAWRRDSPESFK